MENQISAETREKKLLSIVFLALALCVLASNFLSFINSIIGPEPTNYMFFSGVEILINVIVVILAIVLAAVLTIKRRGVFSIIGGIFLVIATLINLMNAFVYDFTLSLLLIRNYIFTDFATLEMFFRITGIVSIIVNFLCLVAYILLAAGTRTSKIFKTTIVATGAFFFFMTVANEFIVPVLLNPDMRSIYYDIYNVLRPAIHIVIIAVCIIEFISANRQAKSCQE